MPRGKVVDEMEGIEGLLGCLGDDRVLQAVVEPPAFNTMAELSRQLLPPRRLLMED